MRRVVSPSGRPVSASAATNAATSSAQFGPVSAQEK